MPTGTDFPSYWKEITAGVAFAIMWWKQGRDSGKAEQRADTAFEAAKSAVDGIKKIKAEIDDHEFCTIEWCEKCRVNCRESINDKLMLALEKRDREFDRKFSQICQGISEIKTELRR